MSAWPVVPLGTLSSPKQWPILTKSDLVDDGFVAYGANGRIGFARTYTHEEPTILVGCRGSCGKVHITGARSYASGNAMALDSLDQKKVDVRFLAYFLTDRGFEDVTTGSSQPQIIRQNLVRVEVPLPPLPEQRRIAAILDQADALRAKRRAALAQLDEMTQAIFVKMFGDPLDASNHLNKVLFEQLTTRITYGFTSPMEHLPVGIPIITAKNVADGKIDFSRLHYAREDQFSALSAKSKPNVGDILITKDGTIGRCAVVEVDTRFCINQSVALVQVNRKEVVPSYLAAYIRMPSIQKLLKGMGKGNALLHLQITELAKLPIVLPPFSAQAQLEERLNTVDDLREKELEASFALERLFSSLQHRAFTGAL